MIDRIRDRIAREQFTPGWLGCFVNPFYFARKGLYRNIVGLGGRITGVTLDVGCGTKPYEALFRSTEYLGLEINTTSNRSSKKADFFYDGSVFPFNADQFDSVVCNEVFEHVFHPDQFLGEIRRTLKIGGLLLMTVPFIWDEHEQPFDFARYSSYGLRAILERNGFEVIEFRKSVCDIRVIFQLVNAYIYKATVSRNKYLNLLFAILLMAPFNLAGEALAMITPLNEDLYLDNVILARKSGVA